MNFDFVPQHIVGNIVFMTVVLFVLYRRFRRNFGRQKLRPNYLIARVVVLCVVGALMLIPTFFSTELAIVTILATGIGVGLALWAAKHTRFLREDGVLYYIPHTYAGMVVTALVVGRVGYRIFVNSQPDFTAVTTGYQPGFGDLSFLSGFYHNPVTRAAFFILIGYYVYYYWFVLHESKNLKDSDMEDGVAVSAKPKPGPGGNISN